MKRAFCNENEDTLALAFATLPAEVQQLIVVYAHHDVSHLNTVCKQWHLYIDSYQDWLNLAQRNYTLSILSRPDSSRLVEKLHTIFDTLQKRHCPRRARFCNYVGRLLNTKLKNVVCIEEPPTDEDTPIIASIYEYTKEHTPNVLTLENYYERDIYLNFTAEGHKYCLVIFDDEKQKKLCLHTVKVDDNEAIDPKSLHEALSSSYGLLSVTTFISTLFPLFDEDEVITKMMANTRKWNDPVENPYYEMTREEIKAQWEMIRTVASEAGTAMHANLEMYYSERPYETDSKEFDLFLSYQKVHVNGKLKAFRTEWTVYSAFLRLCGSIDMLYSYVDEVDHGDGKKHLVLADWKRSKRITYFNSYQSGSVPCTASMGDTNFTHFCIQLCLYKYILERHYNVIIDAMFIVALHPNYDRFVCIPVDWKMIEPYFNRIIDHRLACVERFRQEEEEALLVK